MHSNPRYIRFLTVASWAGNVTLTLLAVYLAYTHTGPLAPLTFFTIALCILLGNALPISVYLINLWWHQSDIRGEESLASDTLRLTIARAEQLTERLQGLQEDAAKSVIIARQVPERIEERIQQLHDLLEGTDTSSMGELMSQFGELRTAVLESTGEPTADKSALWQEPLFEKLDKIDSRMEELLQHSSQSIEAIETSSIESSTRDNKALSQLDSLSEALLLMRGKLDNIISVRSPRIWSKDTPQYPGTILEPSTDNEDESGSEPETAPAEPKKRPRKPKTKDESAVEMFHPQEWSQPAEKVAEDEVILIIKSMIGISNKLYLRGDPPLLDWEAGLEPEMTGIGEWRWSAKGVTEPIKCKVLLNDATWASGGDIVLVPGKIARVEPHF
jgi:hypothetical protein